ncbi:MAG: DUF1801 domain-containing protein [Polaromonas sp.]|jgi:hypothetical protein|nr:DUF1801 domain-containing protein [Polaromonas sp.]MBP6088232.1 DUF1801 domain-containing protein [Polaromonas sp.]MBP7116525.1 DUF1801 domain-containing protein [Polaromonas sp.]MBP7308130.1 DUF1801 domain-containing protein [Polaromonas sp.]MBP8873721.1 DUF1801 domain-containing protein [Polaromonas sp.]
MTNKSIEALVDDFRTLGIERFETVQAVRALVKKTLKPCDEEVKYGGILFASGVQFGGVFVYKDHVSVDFGSGAKIKDPYGYLEGNGKFRRHLKLLNADDIKTKKLDAYLPLALAAAMNKT